MLPEESRKLLRDCAADILTEPTHKLYQDVRNGYQNVAVGAASEAHRATWRLSTAWRKSLIRAARS